jgi:flagellar assembly factor FliW
MSHPEAVEGEFGTVPDDLPEIRFVSPLPGFPELTRFALVRLGDGPPSGAPSTNPSDELFELRSLENPLVGFLVGPPATFFTDYEVDLDDASCDLLGLTDAGDALVLVVLTVGADLASSTANLLAPVVINGRTRDAAQVILSGTDWPVRAPIG